MDVSDDRLCFNAAAPLRRLVDSSRLRGCGGCTFFLWFMPLLCREETSELR